MPIKVTCKCGQQFAAKDELAGKVTKCPKCGQPLKIGAPGRTQPTPNVAPVATGVGDLLDEIGFHIHKEDDSPHCPACDAKLSDHAILCVNCGYNLESGKFAKGHGLAAAGAKAEGHEGAALLLLKKAETSIHQDKQEEQKMRLQGAPVWALVIAVAIIGTLAVGMSVLPRHTALTVAGYVWCISCGLVASMFGIRLVIIAFSESLAAGFMYLFVPFYNLVFIITRWRKCGKPFILNVTLSLLAVLGVVLIIIAPKFKQEETKKDAQAHPAIKRVLVSAPGFLPDGSPATS